MGRGNTNAGGGGGGTKKKHCERCNFEGKVNHEGLCGSCADEGPHLCGKCTKDVRNRDRGLLCEVCDLWYHNGCEKVTVEQYDFLMDEQNEAIAWICRKCKGNIKNYATKIDKLVNENKELKERLERLELNNTQAIEQVKEDVKQEIFEEVEEWMDRAEKKNNVIVFNIEEQSYDSREEKIQEEQRISVELIKEIGINIEKEDIVKVHRIGRYQEDQNNSGGVRVRRPRPLLIKLQDVGTKWAIVKNGKKLKDSNKDQLKHAIIVPDQTRKEREINKKLREELQARKDNGEEGWFIKKGKLERRSFF